MLLVWGSLPRRRARHAKNLLVITWKLPVGAGYKTDHACNANCRLFQTKNAVLSNPVLIQIYEHCIFFIAKKTIISRKGFKQIILNVSHTRWKDTFVVSRFTIISQVPSIFSTGFQCFSKDFYRKKPCKRMSANEHVHYFVFTLTASCSFLASCCIQIYGLNVHMFVEIHALVSCKLL